MSSPTLHRRAANTEAAALLEAHGIAPLFARLYAARGIASTEDASFKLSLLPPPSSMKGIDAVVERLILAIEKQEQMVIVADYDADGATACAIGLRGLRRMGAKI
ncbi:MAG: single-stranded-DNA-specific exonuclease RecJ, partial [Betaproteobacteria bacterium]